MKNRLFLVITFIMMLIGWTGCDSTKTSDELYSECSSGVVLVVNQYYHTEYVIIVDIMMEKK